jgi:hypothetical protein
MTDMKGNSMPAAFGIAAGLEEPGAADALRSSSGRP